MRPTPKRPSRRTALPGAKQRLQRGKPEPKSAWDLGTIGFFISLLSFIVAGYAAWATARQADYAKTALTASELNASFKDFVGSWSRFCNALDISQGFIMLETTSPGPGERLIILG
jgi:hypothetical protein